MLADSPLQLARKEGFFLLLEYLHGDLDPADRSRCRRPVRQYHLAHRALRDSGDSRHAVYGQAVLFTEVFYLGQKAIYVMHSGTIAGLYDAVNMGLAQKRSFIFNFMIHNESTAQPFG